MMKLKKTKKLKIKKITPPVVEKKIRKRKAKASVEESNKKIRVGNYKKSDLNVAIRTLQEMYDSGIIIHRPEVKHYDLSMIQCPYFDSLPEDLRVNKDTPTGTLVWDARDFLKRTRKPYKLLKHFPPTEFDTIGGIDMREDETEGAPTIYKIYDAICIIPDKQRLKHIRQQEEQVEFNSRRKEEKKASPQTAKDVLSKVKIKLRPKAKTKSKAKLKPKTNVKQKLSPKAKADKKWKKN